jgi:hypothetical protein
VKEHSEWMTGSVADKLTTSAPICIYHLILG